ncbi:receptor-type tyrosine-protein phosphatase S [Biomphalaria pfeifferi]|uniref:Receptor-type tyrosine-protein phosphatase S n=1 Tax=Biomphalaria pfeifferi TaxID=112525 RepID=A0AAD8AUM3_BIOPF|nr:receptor-type tyrosine-protein phosphatase S [Biomphalaria pfeifferi]
MSESLTAMPVCTALLLFLWLPLTKASEIFQSVGIKVDTPTQVTVNWTLYPELEPEPMNITLWSKLLGQGDCSNQTGPLLLVGTSALHKGVFVIRNLNGWTRYNISIEGNNSNKYYNQLVTSEVITQENSAPTGQVTQFSVTSLKSYHAVLSWQRPECAQRKGELSSYELLVTRTDSVNSNTTLSWYTNATTYTLRDLYHSSSYIVLVTYVNSIGKGPYSQIKFTTLSNSLPAVEIATMTMTYSTATLTFEPFDSSLGITSLTLAYSQFQDFNSSEFIKITNFKNSPAILNQLGPDTVYYIKAAAVSDDDIGPYGSVAQVRTLKLIDLTLVSRTRNCFFLAWMLPTDVLMYVTNFTLTVTSLTYGLNYQLILDQSTYLKAVCELRPSTLYNVTIVANNNNRVVSLATANFSTDIALPTTPLTPVLVRSTNATVTIAIEPLKVEGGRERKKGRGRKREKEREREEGRERKKERGRKRDKEREREEERERKGEVGRERKKERGRKREKEREREEERERKGEGGRERKKERGRKREKEREREEERERKREGGRERKKGRGRKREKEREREEERERKREGGRKREKEREREEGRERKKERGRKREKEREREEERERKGEGGRERKKERGRKREKERKMEEERERKGEGGRERKKGRWRKREKEREREEERERKGEGERERKKGRWRKREKEREREEERERKREGGRKREKEREREEERERKEDGGRERKKWEREEERERKEDGGRERKKERGRKREKERKMEEERERKGEGGRERKKGEGGRERKKGRWRKREKEREREEERERK